MHFPARIHWIRMADALARYPHHYTKPMRTQPMAIVDKRVFFHEVFHEIFIDFFVHFTFVGTQIQFPSSIRPFHCSHWVRSSRHVFCRIWRARVVRLMRVSARPATVAICNNFSLLPLGNCMRKHFSTGMVWNITFFSASLPFHVPCPMSMYAMRSTESMKMVSNGICFSHCSIYANQPSTNYFELLFFMKHDFFAVIFVSAKWDCARDANRTHQKYCNLWIWPISIFWILPRGCFEQIVWVN